MATPRRAGARPASPDPAARRAKPASGGRREGSAALLRSLPQIDDLLKRPDLAAAVVRHGRPLVVTLLRTRLEALRAETRAGGLASQHLAGSIADLGPWVEAEAATRTASSILPVVNATGVILHTNLGRAPLSAEALRRVVEVAGSYSTLEYDRASGRRGSRSAHLDRVATLLFPGQALHVVNNNAAALMLALNSLAEGREVVVSRGELVEIGGSFRIPDIMRKSGAILREVGTTNRTRIQDYERAIGDRTGLLLKVHPSNYRIVGFTAEVPLAAVAQLGRRRRLPVLMDQGSGNLLDLTRFGIRGEPSVQEALADRADLVCCSGDKLLGGPQAGLLVGRPPLIRRTRENPLSRALRIDKLTYAALEATLLEHARGAPQEGLPTLRMIALGREAIEARARLVAEGVGRKAGGALELRVEPGESLLGGGSAPQEGLPTSLITVRAPSLSSRSLEERLRRFDPPVLGRIEGRRLILDLRTVPPEQDDTIVAALLAAAADPDARTRH